MRETERDAQDHQDAADQQPALGHHPRHIFQRMQVLVDHRGRQQRVKSRHRRRLDRRGKAPEQSNQRDHRQEQFPFRLPDRPARFRRVECLRDDTFLRLPADSPPRGQRHHQHARTKPAQKHFLHRHAVRTRVGRAEIDHR